MGGTSLAKQAVSLRTRWNGAVQSDHPPAKPGTQPVFDKGCSDQQLQLTVGPIPASVPGGAARCGSR